MSPDTSTRTTPLTIEIWSDVLCPFCYIGKREFERALARFPHRDNVDVVWKSFELDPNAPVKTDMDTYTVLSQKYGMSIEEARSRSADVSARAKGVGLTFDFDRAVPSNSFHAHRLLQLAKTKGLDDAMEERLFKAYFTEGAHIGDNATLVRLATEVGLDPEAVRAMLGGDAFSEAVRLDEYEAQQFGIRGVPFFAIDRKYGISGAQASDHFLAALEQAWKERPAPVTSGAPACEPGNADCLPGQ